MGVANAPDMVAGCSWALIEGGWEGIREMGEMEVDSEGYAGVTGSRSTAVKRLLSHRICSSVVLGCKASPERSEVGWGDQLVFILPIVAQPYACSRLLAAPRVPVGWRVWPRAAGFGIGSRRFVLAREFQRREREHLLRVLVQGLRV